MKGHLLDTHTFLWSIFEPDKLGKAARAILSDAGSNVYVSSVTFWEIALKVSVGKLALAGCVPEELPKVAEGLGFGLLALQAEDAAAFYRLPKYSHKDPFDRMLIWQSIRSQLILLSKDSALSAYGPLGLQVVW